jgi:hypothetical protein
MQMQPSYQTLLEISQRIDWQVDDLIGGDKRLDFSRPFLPETFARIAPLTFLNAEEKLALNHIRAHGYLAMFELVETFILPFVVERSDADDGEADPFRGAALKNFAEEEAKHIALFKRFKQEFAEGFGQPCGFIGPADAIASAILAHGPLGVAILVLGIEWMSQGHYVESVKDDGDLDPQFKSLLKHHWMEEAQHAKLDGMMVQALARISPPGGLDRAIDEYMEMGGFFDGGLQQQVALDLESLETRIRRRLDPEERAQFLEVQLQALRWTFLGSAMRNENFLKLLGSLGGQARSRVEEAAPAFC